MIKIKLIDVAFWIIIALIVGVALWKLVGSPTDTAGLISIALFVSGSEILLWKYLLKMENKTNISFMKIKNELEKINSKL